MERLTYDFCIGGNHCWQVKRADNLECREVCQRQEDKGCKDCMEGLERCCGLMGGDNWSDNTMYMCVDCPHYTPIIGGKNETTD